MPVGSDYSFSRELTLVTDSAMVDGQRVEQADLDRHFDDIATGLSQIGSGLQTSLLALQTRLATVENITSTTVQFNLIADANHEHNLGELFATPMMQTIETWERTSVEAVENLAQVVRRSGQSGIVATRQYDIGGDDAYHRPAGVNSLGASGVHNHSNYFQMCGLPELEVALNGYLLQLRHTDYRCLQPVSGDYLEVADAVPSALPPSVTALATPEEQIAEMREYLLAYHYRDTARRDYRNYFDLHVSYIECWHEDLVGDAITDTVQSFRHGLETDSLAALFETYQGYTATGIKPRYENVAFMPRIIRHVDGQGRASFSLLRYRVCTQRLGTLAQWPIEQIISHLEDSMTELAYDLRTTDGTRYERFRVNHDWGDDGLAQRNTPGLLDAIMARVPGLNGGGTITASAAQIDNSGNPFSQTLLNFGTTDNLNAAYYTRFYSVTNTGAAGRAGFRMGYNDPTLFTAWTTMPKVSELAGLGGGVRVSYAIPLELIVMTPLNTWNPYAVPIVDNETNVSGAGTIGDPYTAARQNTYWYLTPAALFSGDADMADAADTAGNGVYMATPSHGAQLMSSAGTWIHIPDMESGEAIRTRFPVAPVHHEGSFLFGEMRARQVRTEEALLRLTSQVAQLQHTLINGGLV